MIYITYRDILTNTYFLMYSVKPVMTCVAALFNIIKGVSLIMLVSYAFALVFNYGVSQIGASSDIVIVHF